MTNKYVSDAVLIK